MTQMKNEHAKDRALYFDVSELPSEPAKINQKDKAKLKTTRYASLRELPLPDENTQETDNAPRPKLIKRTESQRIQDFIKTFITDKNNDLLGVEHLKKMYPSLEIDNTGLEHIEMLNQAYSLELLANKTVLQAIGVILGDIRTKINPKKLKKHVRNIPSGAVWLDTHKLQKFAEDREVREQEKDLIAKQEERGVTPVIFKENKNFGK